MGAVIRDSNGLVVACLAKLVAGLFSPHRAECLALRAGLEMAKAQGLVVNVVESDAVNVVNTLSSLEVAGPIIDDM